MYSWEGKEYLNNVIIIYICVSGEFLLQYVS